MASKTSKLKRLLNQTNKAGSMALKITYGKNSPSKSMEASRVRRKCMDCLWNWENLHTGNGRVCYHNISPRYHKAARGAACSSFESKVPGAGTPDDE